jgi:hypothetical protein
MAYEVELGIVYVAFLVHEKLILLALYLDPFELHTVVHYYRVFFLTLSH